MLKIKINFVSTTKDPQKKQHCKVFAKIVSISEGVKIIALLSNPKPQFISSSCEGQGGANAPPPGQKKFEEKL